MPKQWPLRLSIPVQIPLIMPTNPNTILKQIMIEIPSTPANPANPLSPLSPGKPIGPLRPFFPGKPGKPFSPLMTGPISPTSPWKPRSPFSPLNPPRPGAPLGPIIVKVYASVSALSLKTFFYRIFTNNSSVTLLAIESGEATITLFTFNSWGSD